MFLISLVLISLCPFCICALIQGSTEETMVGIYVVKHNATSKPDNTGVVWEDQMVLHDLDNIALAAAMWPNVCSEPQLPS